MSKAPPVGDGLKLPPSMYTSGTPNTKTTDASPAVSRPTSAVRRNVSRPTSAIRRPLASTSSAASTRPLSATPNDYATDPTKLPPSRASLQFQYRHLVDKYKEEAYLKSQLEQTDLVLGHGGVVMRDAQALLQDQAKFWSSSMDGVRVVEKGLTDAEIVLDGGVIASQVCHSAALDAANREFERRMLQIPGMDPTADVIRMAKKNALATEAAATILQHTLAGATEVVRDEDSPNRAASSSSPGGAPEEGGFVVQPKVPKLYQRLMAASETAAVQSSVLYGDGKGGGTVLMAPPPKAYVMSPRPELNGAAAVLGGDAAARYNRMPPWKRHIAFATVGSKFKAPIEASDLSAGMEAMREEALNVDATTDAAPVDDDGFFGHLHGREGQAERAYKGYIDQEDDEARSGTGRRRRWAPLFGTIVESESILAQLETLEGVALPVAAPVMARPQEEKTKGMNAAAMMMVPDVVFSAREREEMLGEGLAEEAEELSSFLSLWMKAIRQRLQVVTTMAKTKQHNKTFQMQHKAVQVTLMNQSTMMTSSFVGSAGATLDGSRPMIDSNGATTESIMPKQPPEGAGTAAPPERPTMGGGWFDNILLSDNSVIYPKTGKKRRAELLQKYLQQEATGGGKPNGTAPDNNGPGSALIATEGVSFEEMTGSNSSGDDDEEDAARHPSASLKWLKKTTTGFQRSIIRIAAAVRLQSAYRGFRDRCLTGNIVRGDRTPLHAKDARWRLLWSERYKWLTIFRKAHGGMGSREALERALGGGFGSSLRLLSAHAPSGLDWTDPQSPWLMTVLQVSEICVKLIIALAAVWASNQADWAMYTAQVDQLRAKCAEEAERAASPGGGDKRKSVAGRSQPNATTTGQRGKKATVQIPPDLMPDQPPPPPPFSEVALQHFISAYSRPSVAAAGASLSAWDPAGAVGSLGAFGSSSRRESSQAFGATVGSMAPRRFSISEEDQKMLSIPELSTFLLSIYFHVRTDGGDPLLRLTYWLLLGDMSDMPRLFNSAQVVRWLQRRQEPPVRSPSVSRRRSTRAPRASMISGMLSSPFRDSRKGSTVPAPEVTQPQTPLSLTVSHEKFVALCAVAVGTLGGTRAAVAHQLELDSHEHVLPPTLIRGVMKRLLEGLQPNGSQRTPWMQKQQTMIQSVIDKAETPAKSKSGSKDGARAAVSPKRKRLGAKHPFPDAVDFNALLRRVWIAMAALIPSYATPGDYTSLVSFDRPLTLTFHAGQIGLRKSEKEAMQQELEAASLLPAGSVGGGGKLSVQDRDAPDKSPASAAVGPSESMHGLDESHSMSSTPALSFLEASSSPNALVFENFDLQEDDAEIVERTMSHKQVLLVLSLLGFDPRLRQHVFLS